MEQAHGIDEMHRMCKQVYNALSKKSTKLRSMWHTKTHMFAVALILQNLNQRQPWAGIITVDVAHMSLKLVLQKRCERELREAPKSKNLDTLLENGWKYIKDFKEISDEIAAAFETAMLSIKDIKLPTSEVYVFNDADALARAIDFELSNIDEVFASELELQQWGAPPQQIVPFAPAATAPARPPMMMVPAPSQQPLRMFRNRENTQDMLPRPLTPIEIQAIEHTVCLVPESLIAMTEAGSEVSEITHALRTINNYFKSGYLHLSQYTELLEFINESFN